MKAKNGYLILKYFENGDEKATAGGIILPANVDDKDTCGWAEIVEVSQDSQYKSGQRVIYSKYIPTQFKLEETLYIAILEKDVICIL